MPGLENFDEWLSTDPADALDRAQRRREADLERGEQIADEIDEGLRSPDWPYWWLP